MVKVKGVRVRLLAIASLLFLCVLPGNADASEKRFDLVLVHGLTNIHRWSDGFLRALVNEWGSGNVYVIYTNESMQVNKRAIDGKTVTFIGKNDFTAGDDSVEDQARMMAEKIEVLQRDHGLSPQFNIIAHSMGGLVSRQYVYDHPHTVAGLVTLGTSHHGSPLATDFDWASFFLGAGAAMDNLRPEWVEDFNRRCPVKNAPFYGGGKMYTIRGDSDGKIWEWGVMGEIYLGWHTLHKKHGTDSDGMVPRESAVIDGAEHIADFPDYHHLDLVTREEVAKKAAEVLR
ncbi:MAG: alpha/beta fold hydrolase [Planifilum fimeticola]|jgi:pimeloyl-ACP methyl ester carboxylesterase